mmetsp:Transcript_38736/g.62447  ORF Transcript_38736/g.62447 Transcript_38736/m.62447 type:complete len:157 (+) Transcript_38736:129-599(+)|eukprot:CAMPEP_0179439618 /NCGR_PEP_ID=MMETSP0799-20121207/23247_1 /TAXON_ID=46947 /ORGANISM="Geminigera cryophila, Strain CCMP2564" /LENGTH=156 /DNA_ID=CAMNT_0021222207 /DNA_START=126 /DNA_END=596 /DNA_ORIENTATION=-
MDRAAACWALGGAAVGASVAALILAWPGRRTRKRLMFKTKVKQHMLQKYVRHHRGVWPQVEQGLRSHGVRLLSIHQPKDGSNELCMFVETDSNVDMARDLGPGSTYRSDPDVQMWEETMSTFFEGGSWEELEELYTLTATSSTNTMPPLPVTVSHM